MQRKKELNVRRRLCSWWGLNKTYFLVTFASDLPFLVLASSTWAWSSQRLAVLSPSASLGLLAPCPLPLGWPRCLEQGGGGAKAEPGSAPRTFAGALRQRAVHNVCHRGEAAGARLWKCLHSSGGSCGDGKEETVRTCCSLRLLVADGPGRADPGSAWCAHK